MDPELLREAFSHLSMAFDMKGEQLAFVRKLPEAETINQIYNLTIDHYIANGEMLPFIRDLFLKSLIFLIAHVLDGENIEIEKLNMLVAHVLEYLNKEIFGNQKVLFASKVQEKIVELWLKM